MNRTALTLTALAAALLALGGCFIDDAIDAAEDQINEEQEVQAPAQVDCTDPGANPYAGTCVETYLAGCFDPSGVCVGEVSQTGVDLTWANGAEILADLDYSDPYHPGTTATLSSSAGAVCATSVTTSNTSAQDDECFSVTTYTRSGDGAQMAFCVRINRSMTVTCPDGSTFDVDGDAGNEASLCQYGNEAGACEVTVAEQ